MERPVEYSYTEQTQILMPSHINGSSRLFGGRLMEWMDVVAAVVGRRHSGRDVTTVCVDTLEFNAPAHVNDTVIIRGRITYVGRTSMEVRVETYTENREGMRRRINRAYFVLVALDDDENPTEVPRLTLISEEDKLEWQNAEKRSALRKQRRKEHY